MWFLVKCLATSSISSKGQIEWEILYLTLYSQCPYYLDKSSKTPLGGCVKRMNTLNGVKVTHNVFRIKR